MSDALSELLEEVQREVAQYIEALGRLHRRVEILYVKPKDCRICTYLELDLEFIKRASEGMVEVKEKQVEGSGEPVTIIYGLFNGRLTYNGWMCFRLFPAFLEGIALAGEAIPSEAPREAIEKLGDVKADVKLLVSPKCPYCPKALHMLLHLAVEADGLNVEAYSIAGRREVLRAYGTRGVPALIVNEKLVKSGAPKSYEELADLIIQGARGQE